MARSFYEAPYEALFVLFLGGAAAVGIGALRKNLQFAVCGFLLFAAIAGVVRFDIALRAAPDLSPWLGSAVTLRGIVVEEPERGEKTQRLRVRVQSIKAEPPTGGSDLIDSPFLVLVSTRRFPEYRVGDELVLRGVLKMPENYGEFDYVSHLAKENIFSVMSFPEIEKIGEGRGGRLRLTLSKIKASFEQNIDRALPEPHAAFLKGILLGERESLPPGLVEDFKRTGVTHIVALSGYNITLVGHVFIGFLLFLTIPFRVSFWIAIAGIALFVIMTGASPSVVRAGIMGVLVLAAYREGRIYRITNALIFAAAVMVFVNPKILRFDVAFQLSFLATAGLIFLAPRVEEYMNDFREWIRCRGAPEGVSPRFVAPTHEKGFLFSLKRIFVETVSAQLMVLPLLIYTFGMVSLASPLTNLLVLIAVPYAMASGFVAGLIGYGSDFLASIVAIIPWFLIEYKIRVIEFFASLPIASVSLSPVFGYLVILIYGAAIVYFWRKNRTPAQKSL